eukprot:11914269-Alexandrium_andersonii.AAC.1
MDSRPERIAQVAEVAGPQRFGLAGGLPWVSLEPRRPPQPGRANASLPGSGERGGQRRTAWSRDRVAYGLDYGP